MEETLISVIMCTYNETVEYVKMAVESILTQTYKTIELVIVIDNPQNLDVVAYIRKCALEDDRVHFFVNEKNIGLPNSLNVGLRMAKGKIIARMDADDIALKDRIMEEYTFLMDHPEYSVISTNKIIIDATGNVIGVGGKYPTDSEKIKKSLKYVNIILHPGAMFYKDYILKLGGYRNIYAAEDYDLWLRVISDGKNIGILDKNLMKYRMSGNNITTQNAYKMWCTHKYVLNLFYERNKRGVDSYTIDELDTFLKKQGCFDSKNVQKFNLGTKFFHEARFEASMGKYGKAIRKMIAAAVQHKEMVAFIINAVQYKILEYRH